MSGNEQSSAQEFLIDNELIRRRTVPRAQVLACLACRWAHSEKTEGTPSAYGYQISKCSGIKGGTLYPLLEQLEEVGVIESEREDFTPDVQGRPPRKYIVPSTSPLGIEFKESLDVPTVCHLE